MNQNEMRSHGDQAVYLHQMEGYNCSQSIIATYAPLIGYDPTIAYRFAEGFGSGTGRLQGMCGVISAVTMILGYIHSNGDMESGKPRSKGNTYRFTSRFTQDFNDRYRTIICSDLKRPQLPTYTPCADLIRYACLWLDQYLQENNPGSVK